MVRAAILVSGNGMLLQSVLDAMYFGEIPDFELVAVICTDENAYAMRRAKNANVESIVVEPENFPTKFSYSMAISNKLDSNNSLLDDSDPNKFIAKMGEISLSQTLRVELPVPRAWLRLHFGILFGCMVRFARCTCVLHVHSVLSHEPQQKAREKRQIP